MELLAGAFCTFNAPWFLVTFPALTLVYGVVILSAGLTKLQWMVDIIRLKRRRWLLAGISAAVSIICGIVIISSPFNTVEHGIGKSAAALTYYLQFPTILLSLWQYLRFVLLSVLMFAVLALLYTVTQDKRCSVKSLMPGISLSLVEWLIISIGFSMYVENFGSYSVIYGILGTVIVLLVWLYMTSFILILGAGLIPGWLLMRKLFA